MKKTISYLIYIVLMLIASQISGMVGIPLTFLLILTNIGFFYLILFLLLFAKYNVRYKTSICRYNPELFCPKNILYKSILNTNSNLSTNKIVEDNALALVESQFSGDTIWLMSVDYIYESNFNNEFTNVVEENLKRNIHYCMFALDSEMAEQRAKDISNYYKKYAQNITFILMNNSPLELMLPLYNFMIMNPDKVDRKGYICIGENDSGSNTLFKELDKNLVEKVCTKCRNELTSKHNRVINGKELYI